MPVRLYHLPANTPVPAWLIEWNGWYDKGLAAQRKPQRARLIAGYRYSSDLWFPLPDDVYNEHVEPEVNEWGPVCP